MELSSRIAILEEAIREVVQDLQLLPVSPHVRELKAKAVTYERVISNWSTYPPSLPQIEAMSECVAELQEKVRGAHESTRPTAKHEVSAVVKRPRQSNGPAEKVVPDGLEWNATVTATGVRPRPAHAAKTSRPPPKQTTRPPPASQERPGGAGPETFDTPIPALLQTRRQR